MILLNDYQKKIYGSLSSTEYKVFDEVPMDMDLPLIVIGDYTLSNNEVKSNGYNIDQQINIYSDYEGKKEINDIVSIVLDNLEKLDSSGVSDTVFIADVKILESSINRHEEGFYAANLNIQFKLEEC